MFHICGDVRDSHRVETTDHSAGGSDVRAEVHLGMALAAHLFIVFHSVRETQRLCCRRGQRSPANQAYAKGWCPKDYDASSQ